MIRVQNVYYMLAYAFQVLHEQGYKNVATEEFDNVAELLAAILCRGVSVQIKRGLIRQYISREEALASPRGKLEIGESIKTQVIRKKQLVCNYDEFSVDAYPNRIIKTTMDLLRAVRMPLPSRPHSITPCVHRRWTSPTTVYRPRI